MIADIHWALQVEIARILAGAEYNYNVLREAQYFASGHLFIAPGGVPLPLPCRRDDALIHFMARPLHEYAKFPSLSVVIEKEHVVVTNAIPGDKHIGCRVHISNPDLLSKITDTILAIKGVK